ncbi:MAG: hypothetical protein OJF52_002264 [Nitrospira sp.]|jgi:hypothetical protein|nr:MAG: hypothetical protein OJF52_002264 [Nitrospira sp.]
MSMPSFNAEFSLETGSAASLWTVLSEKDASTCLQSIIPASRKSRYRAYCRRLFKQCISGNDPRSFECDSWVILC